MVWVCSECGARNRVFAKQCRNCGRGKAPDLPLPRDARALTYLDHLWTEEVAAADDYQAGAPAPSLLAVGDLLLVADVATNTVYALNAALTAALPAGRIIWTSRLGAALGATLSRLFAVGSYAYVLTANPPYVNRIALDSGRRQILALRTRQGVEAQLPGNPSPAAAPVVVASKGVIPDVNSGEVPLLVLTDAGVTLLILHDDPNLPMVRAYALAGDLKGHAWTTPAISGRWAVATSRNARYLLVDVAALDDEVTVAARSLNEDYIAFSECLAVTGRSEELAGVFLWMAQRRGDLEWDLVIFRPPNTIETIRLPGVKHAGPPIMDGGRILVPGANDQDMYGLWRVFPQRTRVAGLVPNEFLPYAATGFERAVALFPIVPGQLVGVGPRQPWLINTLSAVGSECVVPGAPPYAAAGTPIARSATLVGAQLFVYWDRFATCYGLK